MSVLWLFGGMIVGAAVVAVVLKLVDRKVGPKF